MTSKSPSSREHFNRGISCSSTEKPLVLLKDLSFAYQGSREHVLEDLSFVLNARDRVAVMGKSGAGKSTLLNILALLQDFSRGLFLLNGKNIREESAIVREQMRASWIGMVFQAHYLISYLTVRENVALALELRPDALSEDRIDRVIDGMGLTPRADYLPTQLSGGEQQRVGLARALVKNPLLLLADEPTGNLDEETGSRVLDLMLDEDIFSGAIITVTHQEKIAARFQRGYRLDNGKLCEIGDHARAGIATP